jgi:hypothetical protein
MKAAISLMCVRFFTTCALLLALCNFAWACGLERWAVKTMADGDAAKVAVEPLEASVADLVRIPAHSKKELLAMSDARYPEEKHVYQVEALILGFKHEQDGDFHIVIADPEDKSKTMVVEMPDPDCEKYDAGGLRKLREEFEAEFGTVTAKYKKLKSPQRALVAGVGFFDFIHGQTGVAPNGFELHPVLSFYAAAPGVKPVSSELASVK